MKINNRYLIKPIIISLSLTAFLHFSPFEKQLDRCVFECSTVTKAYAAVLKLKKAPSPTAHFSEKDPSSLRPMLTWTKVKGAVIYEVEFLPAKLPSLERNELSDKRLFSTRQVYVNAYNPDLTEIANANSVFWRVRALNFDGEPISKFSEPEKIYIDPSEPPVNAPVPRTVFGTTNGSTLLYPVYSWLPIAHATQYEVELLDAPPENPNGTEQSEHRIWSAITSLSDKYDEKPRISAAPLYWRVRGLDSDGKPVGVYSDALEFSINPDAGWEIATFGDSISHGGGNMSYSPVDWEYSYQTYLNFPSVNLSNSGDTSANSVERFDEDVLPFHPKYLLILEGTNSIRGGIPADDVINDLKALEDKCLSNNITPIFLTLPPINPASIEKVFHEPTVDNWREEMDKVNQYIRTETIHIDLASKMNYPDDIMPAPYSLDGLHPDIDIKKRMASIINYKLPKIIKSLSKK